MYSGDKKFLFNSEEMEKWLKNFFLDPHTSFLDQTQFRVDLYETETGWIVEALLSGFTSAEVSIYVKRNSVVITAGAGKDGSASGRVRTIEFPFIVRDHKISASVNEGVYEIYISKKEIGEKKDRFITLP